MTALEYTTQDGYTHTVFGCSEQKEVDFTLQEAWERGAKQVVNIETKEVFINPNQNTNNCLYCTTKVPSLSGTMHFQCDNCNNGMCDECYDNMTEHDDIYHRPYESEEWIDERQPEYVCVDCLKFYKYKS